MIKKMQHLIHASVQFVPISTGNNPYDLIDKAIEAFQQSGLFIQVGPLETFIEGSYSEVMVAIERAKNVCLNAGAQELVINLRLHCKKDIDVSIDEKITKYK